MRSQTIHNVVKCRSTHSEIVKEFSLIFSESPIKSTVGAFKCPCGYYRMHPKFSFFPLSASSPPEMKQTQKIKTPIPHGSHVDCSASLTKLTALQGPIAILSVCVYGRPGFYWWEKRYRCRHRHPFYRCVYARPNTSQSAVPEAPTTSCHTCKRLPFYSTLTSSYSSCLLRSTEFRQLSSNDDSWLQHSLTACTPYPRGHHQENAVKFVQILFHPGPGGGVVVKALRY